MKPTHFGGNPRISIPLIAGPVGLASNSTSTSRPVTSTTLRNCQGFDCPPATVNTSTFSAAFSPFSSMSNSHLPLAAKVQFVSTSCR